jgi:hypothetical protein
MKNILVLLILLASCTPVRYVYVDPKDSVIREQRVIYDNIFVQPVVPYYSWIWYNTVPYYNPVIVQPRRPIIVPQRPPIYDRTPIPPRREEPRSYPQIKPPPPPHREEPRLPQIRPNTPPQRQEPNQFPQRPSKWRK